MVNLEVPYVPLLCRSPALTLPLAGPYSAARRPLLRRSPALIPMLLILTAVRGPSTPSYCFRLLPRAASAESSPGVLALVGECGRTDRSTRVTRVMHARAERWTPIENAVGR